jgi:regulator of sigma E protease
MEFAWSVVGFIIAVSLLVTVHEFGHYWVARKLGFKVLRFSVGFGKPILKWIGRDPDRTEYVIASIPLGGYVRMLDERDGSVAVADLPRAFGRRPPWQRILVLLAGPAANITFAILVLWVMFWVNGIEGYRPVIDKIFVNSPAAAAGLRPKDEILAIDGSAVRDTGEVMLGLLDAMSDDGEAVVTVRGDDGRERNLTIAVEDPAVRKLLTEPDRMYIGVGFLFWHARAPAILGSINPDGPAARAGLQVGDEIVSIDDSAIRNFDEFSDYVNARPGQEMTITVRRGGETLTRRVTPSRDDQYGRAIGRIQVAPVAAGREAAEVPDDLKIRVALGPVEAFSHSVFKSWQMTVAQAKFFARMITGQVSTKNISGFISIARISGEAVRAGPNDFLTVLVLLSLSLGFLNLLPIPVLDGGQIVFQVVEWAKGGPLSDRTYMVGQQAGLLLLVLLMGVALFNDLSGIFGART